MNSKLIRTGFRNFSDTPLFCGGHGAFSSLLVGYFVVILSSDVMTLLMAGEVDSMSHWQHLPHRRRFGKLNLSLNSFLTISLKHALQYGMFL